LASAFAFHRRRHPRLEPDFHRRSCLTVWWSSDHIDLDKAGAERQRGKVVIDRLVTRSYDNFSVHDGQ
jgi:hypothetical protein